MHRDRSRPPRGGDRHGSQRRPTDARHDRPLLRAGASVKDPRADERRGIGAPDAAGVRHSVRQSPEAPVEADDPERSAHDLAGGRALEARAARREPHRPARLARVRIGDREARDARRTRRRALLGRRRAGGGDDGAAQRQQRRARGHRRGREDEQRGEHEHARRQPAREPSGHPAPPRKPRARRAATWSPRRIEHRQIVEAVVSHCELPSSGARRRAARRACAGHARRGRAPSAR